MSYKEKSYIYFVTEGEQEDVIKVGTSNDPKSRIKSLQTGNPNRLRLKLIFGPWDMKTAYNYEKSIHFMLRNKHLHGEWFKVHYHVAWRFFGTKDMSYFEGCDEL